jgi:twitching motility protein PilT
VNVFKQNGLRSIVLDELGLPPIFREMVREKTGVILVTGGTGSGKTTTLAAIINELNRTQEIHIVTLEDPVEFFYAKEKAVVSQRELGKDFRSFAGGLRAALRQAPKVILVGEMRDQETVKIALSAAETGHLVLSTLHTINAGETVNRILGMVEPEEQEQVRIRLADSLRWVVSQRLCPRISGGRHALIEIMGSNLRTQEAIRLGESEGKTFYEIIEASSPFGWTTFDQSILAAYEAGTISEETARLFASKKGRVTRGIDLIQKTRGIDNQTDTGLRLDLPANAFR